MRYCELIITGILALICLLACSEQNREKESTLLNTAHLDHLYEEVQVAGQDIGFIHIYAEHPDYHLVGDPNEGMACVDDAARAAIFYLNYANKYEDKETLRKAERLLKFLLYMQSENGYFYNFIWPDHSIHKTHFRSEAKGDWWSYRAMWAMVEALKKRKNLDPLLAGRIENSLNKAVNNVLAVSVPVRDTVYYEGIPCPNWLPYGAAADQSGLLLVVLTEYYQMNKNDDCIRKIADLADGIIMMQQGINHFPYGAFLSWQNTWHAWGNIQSYGLIKTAAVTGQADYGLAALKEIDHFYSKMLTDTLPQYFELFASDRGIEVQNKSLYSQIAYGIRPIVYACVTAYEYTGNEKYAQLAAHYAAWFFGRNPANTAIYDPGTGRCYDGINSSDMLNLNSGAESTIEALLSILAIENCASANGSLAKYISGQKTE